MKLKILSVNISEKKGTIKKPVGEVFLNEHGVSGDAHSGPWHRQVSLLGNESIGRFSSSAGRSIGFGEFAENITTEGMELARVLPLDRFIGKEVELEVTQIGKECHGTSCAIFREVGNCVMPKEGIFARVKRSGKLKPGDTLEYVPRQFGFHVITLSDRASSGVYEDLSGPRIAELLHRHFSQTGRMIKVKHTIIADDSFMLAKIIAGSVSPGSQEPAGPVTTAHAMHTDVIITTGGTGIGPRDITVDTVKPLLDKEIPGIMEMIRVKYGAEKPNALLSRSVAGLIGDTLIYTLPGSVKAVNEYLPEILKTLEHLIYMRNSLDRH